MSADAFNTAQVVLTAINILLTTMAVGVGIWISARNSKIEANLKSLGLVFDKEIDLKIEAKRIARDKASAFMSSVDQLVDRFKNLSDATYNETNRYLRIQIRKEFFELQIYLPNNIDHSIRQLLASCLRAIGHYGTSKFDPLLGEVGNDYMGLINEVRKTFYFESADLRPIIEKELLDLEIKRTLKPQARKRRTPSNAK